MKYLNRYLITFFVLLVTGIIVYFSKQPSATKWAVWGGLLIISILTLAGHHFSQHSASEKIDHASNAIKNIVEIIAIIGTAYLATQTTWYDTLFRQHDVQIIGAFYEQKNNGRTPIEDTIILELVFKSEYLEDLKIPPITIAGKLDTMLRMDKSYTRMEIASIGTKWKFFDTLEKEHLQELQGNISIAVDKFSFYERLRDSKQPVAKK